MNGEILEILIVPWDVERRDTPNARGPRGLLANGFPGPLGRAGREVRVTEIEAPDPPGAASKLGTVIAIGRRIAEAVALALSRGHFPLILSGGCLASLGVVAGLQRDGREAAAVWIDAHGDLNTPESSPSGYWDGMSLAALAGLSLPEVVEGIGLRPLGTGRLAHLAGRSFDPQEGERFERLEILRIPADQIATAASRERLRSLSEGCSLYLHVDVDGLDPRDAPAVGFPEPDGARLADLLALRDGLPAPAAMTLSALSFDRVDEAEARRTVEACARLVETFAALKKNA